MGIIRNLLALVGLAAIIGGGYTYFQINELDPGAKDVYLKMWDKLKETGNSAEATVWNLPLADDVSPADAEEAMKSVANELNMKFVGELPLSEQVKAMTGKKQRFLKIYQFCNPITAMKMVDYSDAFSAYLPCRIALIEDKKGKHSLYALDMDMMIHGGKTLPDELLKEAQIVKKQLQEIMKRGAEGDF